MEAFIKSCVELLAGFNFFGNEMHWFARHGTSNLFPLLFAVELKVDLDVVG